MILKPRPFRKPNLGLPISRGLVGLWLFNEGSGNKVADLSGNGNIGTFGAGTTSPIWTPGKFGSGIWFDADDDVINVVENGTLNLGSDVTIFAWVYITSTAVSGTIIGRYHWNEGGYELYYTTQPRLRFRINNGVQVYDSCFLAGAPATNTWLFIVGTFDGSTMKLYQNGILVKSVGSVSMSQSASATFNIGRGGPFTNTMAGSINYGGVYNRALSASEIVSLDRKPFCMFERSPIELWSAATLGAAPPAGMAGAMTTNTGYWGW